MSGITVGRIEQLTEEPLHMTPITFKRNDAEDVAEYWIKKYGDLLNTNRELQEENKSLRDAIVHMSQLMAGMVKERMEEDGK